MDEPTIERLRETAEAATTRMANMGPAYEERVAVDAPMVLALLEIAEAAEAAIAYEGDDGITYCGTCGLVEDICQCGEPMARLRHGAARLREVAGAEEVRR